MRLYMVRHGETDWNKVRRVQGHTDIPLNAYGRHLAEETAEGMKNTAIDLCFTSPLSRAKETAQIILKGRDIPLIEDERIGEIGFGKYEGICSGGEGRDEESEKFNLFFTDTASYVPPEDGESVEELYERTGSFLEELYERSDLENKNIMISTHGAAMTAMLNRIKHQISVENFWRDEVPPNCSVTVIEVKDRKAEIISEGTVYYSEKVKQWKTV